MKKMMLIAAMLMSAGLMLQGVTAHAQDDASYEESTQGYSDSEGYYEDMPTDEENSGSGQEEIPDETTESEMPSDN